VALASGQSWRTSFMLGVKWGCGHALGIVLVAGVCLALGRAIDFGDTVRDVLNYIIGFFLVILGGWTLYHAKVEYDLQQRPPSKWSSVQCQDATYALLSADDDTLRSPRCSRATRRPPCPKYRVPPVLVWGSSMVWPAPVASWACFQSFPCTGRWRERLCTWRASA
jgi:hypothetical protein